MDRHGFLYLQCELLVTEVTELLGTPVLLSESASRGQAINHGTVRGQAINHGTVPGRCNAHQAAEAAIRIFFAALISLS